VITHVRKIMGVPMSKIRNHFLESIHHIFIRHRIEIGGGELTGGMGSK